MTITKLQYQIRCILILFIIGLVASGLTAFPLEWQLQTGVDWMTDHRWNNELSRWIMRVSEGVHETNTRYPFMAYGTDWLAFAHLVIAVAFIGPLRDPIRNIWVIEFGIIACIGIFPLAFIAGPIRGIPLYWRLIDCSFGIAGGILLWAIHRKIKQLEKIQTNTL